MHDAFTKLTPSVSDSPNRQRACDTVTRPAVRQRLLQAHEVPGRRHGMVVSQIMPSVPPEILGWLFYSLAVAQRDAPEGSAKCVWMVWGQAGETKRPGSMGILRNTEREVFRKRSPQESLASHHLLLRTFHMSSIQQAAFKIYHEFNCSVYFSRSSKLNN